MKKGVLNSAILLVLLIHGSTVCAQENKIISGTVTTFGVIPLNKVEITTAKSGEKVFSDSLGLFSISCEEKDMIKAYASGFDPKRIKVREINLLNIDLVYSNTDRSMADAIDNGHITREDLEIAINKYPLKGGKDYSHYSNIYDLIKTEIYNVNVNGTSITTTKPTSINSSQEILCVVNGTMYDDISFVLPNEVKSVRYLDGPGATLYGIRGGNGVIEITIR